jgi:hypothetical protein
MKKSRQRRLRTMTAAFALLALLSTQAQAYDRNWGMGKDDVKYSQMWNHMLRFILPQNSAREEFSCSYTTRQCKFMVTAHWAGSNYLAAVKFIDERDRSTVIGYALCLTAIDSYICFDPQSGRLWDKDGNGGMFNEPDRDRSPPFGIPGM